MKRVVVRPIAEDNEGDIRLVAMRMRATLVEVLGKERGEAMYSLEWLEARVRYHFDRNACEGEVLGAYNELNDLVGHTILRQEVGEDGAPFGLFSTIYVIPDARRSGAASQLIAAGEAWMAAHGLQVIRSYTDHNNEPLIQLFTKHGYAISMRKDEFVILEKGGSSA